VRLDLFIEVVIAKSAEHIGNSNCILPRCLIVVSGLRDDVAIIQQSFTKRMQKRITTFKCEGRSRRKSYVSLANGSIQQPLPFVRNNGLAGNNPAQPWCPAGQRYSGKSAGSESTLRAVGCLVNKR